MSTVFIADMAVALPCRFSAGDIATDLAAQLLNSIQLNRIRSRLRYFYGRGEISEAELQAKANEFSEQELTAYVSSDDEDADTDPIFVEAVSIARELIIRRMAEEGLPPPRGLDGHAKALVDGSPIIMENARLRVEARYKAATAAIANAL